MKKPGVECEIGPFVSERDAQVDLFRSLAQMSEMHGPLLFVSDGPPSVVERDDGWHWTFHTLNSLKAQV